jgi:hypothetical protein
MSTKSVQEFRNNIGHGVALFDLWPLTCYFLQASRRWIHGREGKRLR